MGAYFSDERQEIIDESALHLLEEVSLTLQQSRMITAMEIFVKAAEELARVAFECEPDSLLEEQAVRVLAALK